MTKLSVAVVTYNEEKNIGRCLESVKGVADEIIVVDSFSTDRTKEICLSYKATFIENRFEGYMEQKNFALAKAANLHVLSLDADEALSKELFQSIIKEKEKNFPADAYTMNRLNFYCGKWIRHGTYYPDRKLRLVNKQKGNWGPQNPHEKLMMQENTTVTHLEGDLLHYTYQSAQEHSRKMDLFSNIAAQTLFNKGKHYSSFKMLMSPAWAFIKGYFIKLGFLDGKQGFWIAKFTARQSYLKYRKLSNLYKKSLHSVN